MLSRIFGGRGRTVICPKCLNTTKVAEDLICNEKLPNGERCGYQFPIRYAENFKDADPLFIQVFGWTAHGKTVFLDALRLVLLDMRKLWPEYVHQSVTELDMEHEKVLRASLRKGEMPRPTDKRDRQQNEVYIMEVENMVRYGSRWLVLMDFAGEMFARFDVPVHDMPFLIKTQTTFLLLSIPQMTRSNKGESLDQLMNIYIETMTKHKVDFKRERRKLVIVLTMADDLLADLPDELRDYLRSDDIWSRLRSKNSLPMTEEEMAAYVENMEQASRNVREWLLTDSDGAPGGANLVALIERNGIEARYALISATGHAPDPSNQIPISPYRVLDPFFFALEMDGR